MVSSRIAISIAALAASAGCSRVLDDALNPTFCAAHPSDIDCRRAYPDAQSGCTSSDECAAPTPVCVVETRACVQCTPDATAACKEANPVCGGDNVCRACSAHTECGSTACLPTGACGDDTSVAYVDPLGSGTQCTKASPCVKVDDAIKTGRPYVKFHGTTDEQLTLNGASVAFLADPGARLTSTKNGILLKIDGATQLAVHDLEIGGASGPNAAGISLQPGNTATVDLVHVTISGNGGFGILASGGTLNVSRSTIVDNDGGGISASGGTLNVSRSTIVNNDGGGISLTASSFHIAGNVIGRNGSNSAAAGGVELKMITSDDKFEFNTIIDNTAALDTISAGGVLCNNAAFVAVGNLIFRNIGGETSKIQTRGGCTYSSSFISAGADGADNTPMFAHPNTAPFDYHLTAATPATIVDAAGSCTGTDLDGDARPVGAACDIGADERRP